MRRKPPSRPFAVLAMLAVLASIVVAVDGAPPARAADGPLRQVIVQLSGAPALASVRVGSARTVDAATRQRVATARQAVREAQRDVTARARSAGVRLDQVRAFDSLFNGMAVRVPEGQVDALRRVAGVRAVHPDIEVQAADDDSLSLIGAPEVWEREDPQGRPARGAGQTVAILDTGIDYTHPDLGGGFGEGHKVVGGYDFANGDADPVDDNGHGTHVAGIVAAEGDVTGVAPEANLMAYKVLDRRGSGTSSAIIAGLEAAVAPTNPHRAGVVNMSLGGYGDGTDPLGQAASAAVRAGAVVVASAGNAGPGAQTVSTPAAADGVLAVGASTSGLRLPSARLTAPRDEVLESYRVPFSANPPAAATTARVVDVGDGTPADYERVGDVSGAIVLSRGKMPSDSGDVATYQIDKAREAERRGALAMIGWDTSSSTRVGEHAAGESIDVRATVEERPGEVTVQPGVLESGDDLRLDRLVVLGIDRTQYTILAADLADGPVRVRIASTDSTDEIASFSSRGPSNRFGLKPELVAPGVEIRSTVPKALHEAGAIRMSGTSMAAPQVAGSAALVRQLHADRTPAHVVAALVGASQRLDGTGPNTQGAGRLDVAAAVTADVTASPAALSLGLVDMAATTVRASGVVELDNPTGRDVTAVLRMAKAPGSPGTVRVTPSRVTLPAGGSAKVTVRVSAPRPTVDTDLGGWLAVDLPGGATDLRVPFAAPVRPLVVQASPDPSDGTSTAFVYSPAPLSSPPIVTVHPPKGRPTKVTARLDHGSWYRAEVTGRAAGTYRLEVSGWVAGGEAKLVGAGAFEVVAADSRDGRWEPVGPNSQARLFSTSAADPDLGVVTNHSDADPWITRDKGRTWRQLGPLPVAAGEGEVIVDPKNPRQMWYAVSGRVGAGVMDPTYEGKVLRSRDGGKTWTTLDFPNVVISEFLSDPAGQALVAVGESAVLVSRDAGDTWTSHAYAGAGYLYDAAMSRGDLFYIRGNTLYRMRNVTGVPQPAEPVTAAGPDPYTLDADDRDLVVVGTDEIVRRSSDRGQTWTVLYKLPAGAATGVFVVDGAYYAATTSGRWYSDDRGSTWQQYAKPNDGAIEHAYAKWPGDSKTLVTAANQAGLFSTTDRQHYRRIGVQGRTINDLTIGREADGSWHLATATVASMYRTKLPTGKVTPATAEWGLSGGEARNGVELASIESAPSDPHVLWRVKPSLFGDFTMQRSDDGGATWADKGRTSQWGGRVAISHDDPGTVAVPFGGVDRWGIFTTTDDGETWRRLYTQRPVTALAFDPANSRRLWIGTDDGLYRSDDGGATTRRVTTGRVTAIAVDPRAPKRVVAGGDVLKVSTDGGRTFTTGEAGDLPMRVSDVVVSVADARTLYAGTTEHAANGLVKGGRGVLRSTDGGRTWENVSTGLQKTDVTSLVQSPDGHFLFAGTEYGGVHRLRLPR
ncbi:MAG: S8 family serine peptidase [Streptosporangiales bacterium]|nr:S8 family serine peptidase [Streptosporangiales bacterium]